MASHRARLPRFAVLLAACALAAGCGKPKPPEPVTVEGKVVGIDGKPLTGLVLTFHPQEDVNKASRPSAHLGQKDGSFRLDCIPGRYKATLTPVPRQFGAEPGSGPGPGPIGLPKLPEGLPRKYLSATDSDLTVDVPAEGARNLVLQLKRQ